MIGKVTRVGINKILRIGGRTKMSLDDHDCDALDRTRELMGEHFRDFVFCVITQEGDFYYDYSNQIVGEALMKKATREIEAMEWSVDQEDYEIEWIDEEEEDGEGWKQE